MEGITSTAASPLAIKEHSKLQNATEEFEAMLLQDLLKSGPKMGTVDGGQDGNAVEGYDDFSTEAVASALAAHGGVGIGRMLLKQLEPVSSNADIKVFSSSADHIIAGN